MICYYILLYYVAKWGTKSGSTLNIAFLTLTHLDISYSQLVSLGYHGTSLAVFIGKPSKILTFVRFDRLQWSEGTRSGTPMALVEKLQSHLRSDQGRPALDSQAKVRDATEINANDDDIYKYRMLIDHLRDQKCLEMYQINF